MSSSTGGVGSWRHTFSYSVFTFLWSTKACSNQHKRHAFHWHWCLCKLSIHMHVQIITSLTLM
jgi:hypothetical protein